MPQEARIFLSSRKRFILDVVRYYQRHYPEENQKIIKRCQELKKTRLFATAKMKGFEDIRWACSVPGKIERAMLGTINNPQFLTQYFSLSDEKRAQILQMVFNEREVSDPSYNYQETPFLREEKELLWFIKTFPEYAIPQKV